MFFTFEYLAPKISFTHFLNTVNAFASMATIFRGDYLHS